MPTLPAQMVPRISDNARTVPRCKHRGVVWRWTLALGAAAASADSSAAGPRDAQRQRSDVLGRGGEPFQDYHGRRGLPPAGHAFTGAWT